MTGEFDDDAVATDSSLGGAQEEYARALQTAAGALHALGDLHPRALACRDPALRLILDSHIIQLKETLVMVLEWLRQQDPVMDAHMRAYLFQRAELTPPEVPEGSVAPAPVEVPPAVPVHTPAKGLPLTLPNQRIRG